MGAVIIGDALAGLRRLPAEAFDCVVTSPAYFEQRDYGVIGQMGHEPSPEAFVEALVAVFGEVRRVLKPTGTVWINIGDSVYSGNGQPTGSDPRSPNRNWIRQRRRWLDTGGMGLPKKSLLGLPWRLAHALQADGWTIRQEIVWARSTALSEPSVKDRPHRQHETIFLLSKSRRYWFDRSKLSEESVWHIEPERSVRQHIAPFPQELVRRCIESGCPPGGSVLDPFGGSGTTGLVASRLGRDFTLIELNPEMEAVIRSRIGALALEAA